jgi:hypothetical protein
MNLNGVDPLNGRLSHTLHSKASSVSSKPSSVPWNPHGETSGEMDFVSVNTHQWKESPQLPDFGFPLTDATLLRQLFKKLKSILSLGDTFQDRFGYYFLLIFFVICFVSLDHDYSDTDWVVFLTSLSW